MSWRMHLAIVDLEKIKDVRDYSPEYYDYDEEEDECGEKVAFYQFVANDFGCKEDYCIGYLPIPKNIGEPFYRNPETQEFFEEYNPRVIGKEDCKRIIDIMRQFIVDYFQTQLERDQNTWQTILKEKLELWQSPYGITPYNLSDNSKDIVNAFNAEYQIFEMVRMYKTINWEKDAVIFFGW